MTPDIQELKRLAEAAKRVDDSGEVSIEAMKACMDFDDAASPSTILALIEVAEAAKATTANYDRLNPMRTADFHGEECSCFRCSIDRLRTALEGVKK